MGDEIQATPTPQQVVEADLQKYPELLPGAAKMLAGAWGSTLGTMPRELRAEELEKRMAGPLAARYRNPEYVAPTLEGGGTPSTLRQILTRQADRLGTGAIDKLMISLAPQTNGKAAPAVARIVEQFLGSRDAHEHLAVRPELPEHEQRIIDLLYRNFAQELSHEEIARLARDKSGQFRSRDDKMVIAMVGKWTLRLPDTDPRVSGQTDYNAPRTSPAPKPVPSGQVEETPPPAPKRKNLAF
jgi:hypothetical protein